MTERKRSVYTIIPKDFSGSNYYRQFLPLGVMESDLKKPIFGAIDRQDATIPFSERALAQLGSDFNLLYQLSGAAMIEHLKNVRSCPAVYTPEGTLRYPPCYIADSDDDLFNVHPSNSAYNELGTRDAEGNEMEDVGDERRAKGEGVEHWATMPDGSKRLVWKDGVNWSLKDAKARLNDWREMLKLADLVTVTTPRVGEYIKREVPTANVFVSPNAIHPRDYPEIKLAPHPGEVWIMWHGGGSHWQDLEPLIPAMRSVALRRENVKFIFFGQSYPALLQAIPRSEHVDWVAFEAFSIRLSTIGHDIAICPLRDNTFNRSRSAVKWYENSSLYHTPATLAQATGPYLDEIEEGVTGMLFNTPEEFEDKLIKLIDDAELRKTLAANAKQWVMENRSAAVVYAKLYDKYMETLHNFHANHPIAEDTKVDPNAPVPEQQHNGSDSADPDREGGGK